MPSSKRIVVVVNKWWERDPAMGVLLHAKARPQRADARAGTLPWYTVLHHPRRRPSYAVAPAAPLTANSSGTLTASHARTIGSAETRRPASAGPRARTRPAHCVHQSPSATPSRPRCTAMRAGPAAASRAATARSSPAGPPS